MQAESAHLAVFVAQLLKSESKSSAKKFKASMTGWWMGTICLVRQFNSHLLWQVTYCFLVRDRQEQRLRVLLIRIPGQPKCISTAPLPCWWRSIVWLGSNSVRWCGAITSEWSVIILITLENLGWAGQSGNTMTLWAPSSASSKA